MKLRQVIVAALLSCTLIVLGGCSAEFSENDNTADQVGYSQQAATREQTQAEESDLAAAHEDGNDMSRTLAITTERGSLAVDLVENSSADALLEMLADGPVTVDMEDYASMEKVGSLGRILPTNDQSISTTAGDVILYQGDKLVIYYSTNSWSFTRLGRVQKQDISRIEEVLGSDDVTVTLEIN